MRYILNAGQKLTKEDIDDIIEKVESTYPEGSEVVMTLAEQFREEGKIQGIQEGENKALAKTAIRLLTKKFGALPEDARLKIEKLDIVTLEIIIDEILEYKSLEGVKKYVQ
jgi:predicted transposase YdaD